MSADALTVWRSLYEYAWVYGDDAALTEHGDEGWEAVGVTDDIVLMRRVCGVKQVALPVREDVAEAGNNIEVEDADHPTDIDVHDATS